MLTRVDLQKILGSENIQARKRLGQNFLVDQAVITRLIKESDLSSADTVLEIGPGLGSLTEGLVKQAGRVLAVEKDRKLSAYLSHKFSQQDNLKIIAQDIFKLDFLAQGLENLRYKIVANLPFYLTSHFLRFVLEHQIKPSLLVLLVQKEVAERIIAMPGKHSLLSLSVQFYSEPVLLEKVNQKSFYPVPEVDAALLKLKVFSQPRVKVDDVARFFRLL